MDVELPKLADTLVEGTVSRWLKQAGETVRKGEPLVEIETDKVNSELEAPADGVLEILVAAGETVPVGQVIARIGGDATPVGVHHAMTAPAPAPAAPAGGLSSMRRRIAERMQEARARIPQGACVREVDVSHIQRGARGRGAGGGKGSARPAQGGSPPSWTAYFVKALAAAVPVANVGVAVEVPGGLLVPVVRDVPALSLEQVSERIADLAERAREGGLKPDEVTGGGFTITNVGGGGTLMAFPLVNPGEPGILAQGAIREGRCFLTLCYDRRAYDDYAADRLLARVEEELTRL
jgi:2-oxoglutarate dehydrogenase E2 component (dihydrolipoamide succinyltransferase)